VPPLTRSGSHPLWDPASRPGPFFLRMAWSRNDETIIEATYQYQVTPWWQLQADFQYAFRPAGGIPNADNPSQRVGNEAVVGVRSSISF
jgi:carbohydrate-selective porin OprB